SASTQSEASQKRMPARAPNNARSTKERSFQTRRDISPPRSSDPSRVRQSHMPTLSYYPGGDDDARAGRLPEMRLRRAISDRRGTRLPVPRARLILRGAVLTVRILVPESATAQRRFPIAV